LTIEGENRLQEVLPANPIEIALRSTVELASGKWSLDPKKHNASEIAFFHEKNSDSLAPNKQSSTLTLSTMSYEAQDIQLLFTGCTPQRVCFDYVVPVSFSGIPVVEFEVTPRSGDPAVDSFTVKITKSFKSWIDYDLTYQIGQEKEEIIKSMKDVSFLVPFSFKFPNLRTDVKEVKLILAVRRHFDGVVTKSSLNIELQSSAEGEAEKGPSKEAIESHAMGSVQTKMTEERQSWLRKQQSE
jgi:hypothetical protein